MWWIRHLVWPYMKRTKKVRDIIRILLCQFKFRFMTIPEASKLIKKFNNIGSPFQYFSVTVCMDLIHLKLNTIWDFFYVRIMYFYRLSERESHEGWSCSSIEMGWKWGRTRHIFWRVNGSILFCFEKVEFL